MCDFMFFFFDSIGIVCTRCMSTSSLKIPETWVLRACTTRRFLYLLDFITFFLFFARRNYRVRIRDFKPILGPNLRKNSFFRLLAYPYL